MNLSQLIAELELIREAYVHPDDIPIHFQGGQDSPRHVAVERVAVERVGSFFEIVIYTGKA